MLQLTVFTAEGTAQERLQLSATSEQGAVATYSAPLDVRKHTQWRDRSGGLDLGTVRITGSVQNSSRQPIRVVVFAVPEETYRAMAKGDSRMTRSRTNPPFLALFSIDVRPSTVVDLRKHAPRTQRHSSVCWRPDLFALE